MNKNKEEKKNHKLDYLEETNLYQSGLFGSGDGNEENPDAYKIKDTLLQSSWEILKSERQILLFPLISLIINLSLFASMYFIYKNSGPYLLFLIIFLLIDFTTIYFNTALIGTIQVKIKGIKPSFGDGIKASNKRIINIIEWSLYSTTVGLLLSFLESFKIVRWFAYAGEVGWALVRYFVIPIIVFEEKGVDDAIRESKNLIKMNWGKSISGDISLVQSYGMVFLAFLLIVIFVFALGFWKLTEILVIAGILIFLISNVVFSTVRSIYQTVLYLYAKDKNNIKLFSNNKVRDSFKPF